MGKVWFSWFLLRLLELGRLFRRGLCLWLSVWRRLRVLWRARMLRLSQTLTQEIIIGTKPIDETQLYQDLHDRYVHNLKEKVLDPFLDNENFRKAVKDFNEESFKTYDKRIRNDATFLMKNLCEKYAYTEQGAKEVCIYVIDNDLPKRFAK